MSGDDLVPGGPPAGGLGAGSPQSPVRGKPVDFPTRRAMVGAIDTHVHAMPFINESDMNMDIFELSREAALATMGAIVLKPYFGSSCQIAYLANKYAGGVPIIGGVTLNFAAGGFNPDAVLVAADEGVYEGFRPGRVVWMPERSALHRAKRLGFPAEQQAKYLSPFRNGDPKAGLIGEAKAVLEVIAERDLVLATSHISPEEGLALIQAAHGMGARRFLLTHASHDAVGYTLEQKKRAIEMGAYVEEVVLTWEPAMSLFHYSPIDANRVIFEAIDELGPDHYTLGTDSGFWVAARPADAYSVFVSLLLRRGLSVEDVRKMTVDNPTRLLRLDRPDDRPPVTRDQIGN